MSGLVVALIGLPGAGKSGVARALEQAFGMQRICRDQIRGAMFPDCSFSMAEKRAAFRSVRLALEVNCALGRSSVLDGMTFSRSADLQSIDRIVSAHGMRGLPIFVDCPPALARERIANDPSTHPAGDRVPELVDQVLARFDRPPAGCAVIDATRSEREMCDAAIALVAAALAS